MVVKLPLHLHIIVQIDPFSGNKISSMYLGIYQKQSLTWKSLSIPKPQRILTFCSESCMAALDLQNASGFAL